MAAILPQIDSLMPWLLRTSLQASVVVVVVLAAQWALRRRLSATWRHALWLLVLARLAAPTAPQTPWSVFNLGRAVAPPDAAVTEPVARDAVLAAPPPPTAAPKPTTRPAAPTRTVVAAATPTREPPAKTASTGTPPAPVTAAARTAPRQEATGRGWAARLWRIAAAVWAMGAAALLGRLAWVNVRFHRRLRRGARPIDAQPAELLDACRAEIGLRRPVEAIQTPAVASPVLFGWWRPRLLLPVGLTQALTPAQLRHVFRHELAHVKRFDAPLDWLATVVSIGHWFNPLIWLALRRMRSDRELACDEMVLRRTAGADAHGYGQTMIRLLAGLSRPTAPAGTIGIAESRNLVKRRLRMIAEFKPNRRRGALVGLLLVVGLGLVVLTNARAEPFAAAPKDKSASPPAGPAKAAAPKGKPAARTDKADASAAKLSRRIERLNFQEIDLADVFQFLREYSEHNIHVYWAALGAAGIELDAKVSVDVRDITVERALKLVLRDVSTEAGAAGKLAYAVDDGVVIISTAAELARSKQSGAGGEIPTVATARRSKADAAVRQKLLRTIKRLNFEQIDLRDVCQFLREYSDVNLHVNWRALGTAGYEPGTKVNVEVKHVTVRRALELILRDVGSGSPQRGGLAYTIDDGVLTVSTLTDLAQDLAAATTQQWFDAFTHLAQGHTVTLSFLKAGKVSDMPVSLGEKVKKGQRIAQLDDAVEREKLEQLRAEATNDTRIKAAKAELTQQTLAIKGVEALVKTAAAPATELKKAELGLTLAELALKGAIFEFEQSRRKLRQAEIELTRMRLVSPIDGRVEKISANVGEAVNAMAPVVQIVKVGPQPLCVGATIPFREALRLRKGGPAFVRFGANGPIQQGKVAWIASQARGGTGELEVRVELPNPTGRPAGERVTVCFSVPGSTAKPPRRPPPPARVP